MKSLKFCLVIGAIAFSQIAQANIWTDIKSTSAAKVEMQTTPRMSFDIVSSQHVMLASENKITALYKFYENRVAHQRMHGATNLPLEVDVSCYPEGKILRCVEKNNKISDLTPGSEDIFTLLQAHVKQTLSNKQKQIDLKLKEQMNPTISFGTLNLRKERHPFEFGGANENISNAQDFIRYFELSLYEIKLPTPPKLGSTNKWTNGYANMRFVTLSPCVSILEYSKDYGGNDDEVLARHESFGIFSPNVKIRGYLLRQPIDFGKMTNLSQYEQSLNYINVIDRMINLAGTYPYEMKWPILDSTSYTDKTALKDVNELSYYDHTRFNLIFRTYNNDIADRLYYAMKYLQVHCALRNANNTQ